MDHPWEELFLKTLNMAYEFRFVRIISLEGKAVMPLLKDVKARMSDAERPKRSGSGRSTPRRNGWKSSIPNT